MESEDTNARHGSMPKSTSLVYWNPGKNYKVNGGDVLKLVRINAVKYDWRKLLFM